MIYLVLYVLVSGQPVEVAIRSSDGVNYDTFPSMEACEKVKKQDMADNPQVFSRSDVMLVCEKRNGPQR